MGDISQVSVGDGILKLAGADAGFLRNVQITRNLEQLELKTGNPRRLQTSVPVEETFTLSAEFLELSMINFSRFMGLPLAVVTASPVTVTNKLYTFSDSGNYDNTLQRIILDGPNATSLVIKSADGETTYVAGTDYLMDGTSKGVIRLSGGDIDEDEEVSVSYSYTPIARSTIKGGASYDLQRFPLEFRHPKYKAGTDLVISHSIVEPSPNFQSSFSADDFIANNVTFNFIYDESRAANGNPLYTFDEVGRGVAI